MWVKQCHKPSIPESSPLEKTVLWSQSHSQEVMGGKHGIDPKKYPLVI